MLKDQAQWRDKTRD